MYLKTDLAPEDTVAEFELESRDPPFNAGDCVLLAPDNVAFRRVDNTEYVFLEEELDPGRWRVSRGRLGTNACEHSAHLVGRI